MTSPHPNVGVIHIALQAYGLAPFCAFLDSYRLHPSGLDHDLIVILKGFGDPEEAAPFLAALGPTQCIVEYQSDGGFDIGSYYQAMRTHVRDVYCLFNSRSRILGDDWLAKLCTPLARPDIGMVGATASCESLFTDHLRDCAVPFIPAGDLRSRIRQVVRRSPINHVRHWLRFPPFPNPHLRTNGFAIRRSVAMQFAPRNTDTRARTAAFENGRHNLTIRLARAGLNTLVAGRDGQYFDRDRWSSCGGFWQDDQANLLVADNQTDRYASANQTERRALQLRAWGTTG